MAEVAVVVAAAAVAAVAVAAVVLARDNELLQGRTAVHCLVRPSSMVDLQGGQTLCYSKDNTCVVIGFLALVL